MLEEQKQHKTYENTIYGCTSAKEYAEEWHGACLKNKSKLAPPAAGISGATGPLAATARTEHGAPPAMGISGATGACAATACAELGAPPAPADSS